MFHVKHSMNVLHGTQHLNLASYVYLGALIHPKDPELILAIESCLKGLLQAFCCDNHSDERALQLLMSKYYARGHRPQIIVNKFQNKIYDTSQR